MKFVCLGYIEPGKFENLPEKARNDMMDTCFAYDDVLRRNGHFAGGEALQPPGTAVTLRFQGGKVVVTDGPYTETKEQLGGYFLVDVRDRAAALDWAARCPGAAYGAIEVREVWTR